MRWLLTAILLSLAFPSIAADDGLALGRAKAEAFLSGNLAEVWEDMTPEFQQLFGNLEGLASFRSDLENDFGQEIDVLSEEAEPKDGLTAYRRTARWTRIETPILVEVVITNDSLIAGLVVKPLPKLAESRFLDYETKTPLRLPFEGEWFVVWGGRTLEANYHAADRAQRFAIDALIYRDGATHQGDPDILENYHCWDMPILAPAAGKVVVVVSNLPDNAIGSTDTQNPAGNHIVLDFGNGEFAFLAHMREGSAAVRVGDRVSARKELGRCGNSGNTSEPHLHFHLQTTPDLSSGEGLPAIFEDYVANGKHLDRGEPQAGQYVQSN